MIKEESKLPAKETTTENIPSNLDGATSTDPNAPNKTYPARSMPAFKLKDQPALRAGMIIPLKKTFGFIPEIIVVQKVLGQSNYVVVSALLTPEMLLKEKTEVKA